VRPRGPGALSARAEELSGGNQQKFVIARELLFDPKVLIAAQVTRGVDIGAARKIHAEILKRRDAGMSAVIFSSDLDEIRALSDRIVVMYRGRRMGPYDSQSLSDAELGLAMGGVEPVK
jgi:simple sugar transport system ATP-binding protein